MEFYGKINKNRTAVCRDSQNKNTNFADSRSKLQIFMARYKITNARIVTYDQIISGELCIDGDKIAGINIPFEADFTIDAGGCYVSPGFVDIHTHGGFGHDYMDCTEDAFTVVPQKIMAYGTTSVVPTFASGSSQELFDSIRTYEKCKHLPQKGANVLGLHLEGPYFSPAKAGAQDPGYIRNPDKAEYMRFLEETDGIIRWSAAPELPGALEFGRDMVRAGVLPAIAHSDATYEQVLPAFDAGFTLMTHLYNGMSSITKVNSYRFAGVLESAFLIDGMDVEIIADGRHLPASLLRFVTKFKPVDKIALITDSIRGAGSKDGEYSSLGSLKNGQKVIIEDQVAKALDKSHFAGSVATSDRLVRNMINLVGCSVVDAVRMAATVPARLSKASSKGIIKPGYDADIVIFDENVNIKKTIIGGEVRYSADAE